jgi:hypothetical protein
VDWRGYPGVKRQGREVNHSRSSRARLLNFFCAMDRCEGLVKPTHSIS